MGNQRASIIDLDDDENLEENLATSLTEVIKKPAAEKPVVNPDTVEAVAENLGFTHRQQPAKKAPARRNRRKKSPFTEQLGVKVRPGMREIFQDLGELIGEYDHTTFERALLALIKEEGAKDILNKLKKLTK